MDRSLTEQLERTLRVQIVGTRAAAGGYTQAANWVADLADGRSVFVKAAVDDQTAAWLRNEHRVYSQLTGPFLPAFIGWNDEPPVLILEDLSAAHWPPPWPSEGGSRVLQALDQLHQVASPSDLPTPEEIDELRDGWRAVARDPGPFLTLALCSREWLVDALPAFLARTESAVLDGDSVVHLDVRSDNLCFRGDQCVLVDWSHAARGNRLLDATFWLPSFHLEGGPPPPRLATEEMNDLAVVFAGYLASRAGLPEPAGVSSSVRSLQLAQLRVALPWAAKASSLRLP